MKVNYIKAPYLPYEEIRILAEDFLGRYNPDDIIPVPIEEIAEFKLKINIIPANSLRFLLGIDGWISNDFKYIFVDSDIYDSYNYRYFFTIAHEIGHMFLHRDIFESLNFSDIESWKNIIDNINPKQYGYIEAQAYNFAGLILVPENHLREEYDKAIKMVEAQGFDKKKHNELFNTYVSNRLQKIFNVSSRTIELRIRFDNLS